MERKLTTEEVEILLLLNTIIEFTEKENIKLDVELNEVIACSFGKDGDLVNEIIEQLEICGYVDEDYRPTYDGKRYLKLFMEYVKEQKEQPIVNNHYSLISIDELRLSAVGSLFEMNNQFIDNVNIILAKIFNK